MLNTRIIFITLIVLLAVVYGQQGDAYYKAEAAFFKQDYSEAIRQCNLLNTDDPYYENSLILKGHIYIKLDSLDASEQSFMDVLKRNPKSALAYNGLGIVHFQKISDRVRFVQLFKKIFVETNEQKAERMFLRALEFDASYLDARYNLARLYIRSRDHIKQVTAENILNALVRQFPDNEYYLFEKGRVKLKLDKMDEAEICFTRILSANPYHNGAGLELALIKFRKEKYEEFTRYFYGTTANLTDPDLELQLIRDTWDILSDAEQKVVKLGGLPKDHFYKYWYKKDPNPITTENERLIIHYQRLQQARETYGYNSFSGYDDRGKVMVKYGDPDNRFQDAVPSADIKANESWAYKVGSKNILFDFVEEGAEYVLVDDLSEAINFSSSGPDGLRYLQNLYERRTNLDMIYDRIAGELSSITVNNASQTRSVNTVYPILNKYKVNQLRLKKSMPVSKFTYELPGNDLPFEFNYAYFFEPSGKTRLEMYYAFDVPAYVPGEAGAGKNWNIDQDIVIQTNDHAPVVQGNNIIKIDKSKFGNRRYITQTNIFTDERDLICSVQLQDKAADRKRLITFPIHLAENNGRDLQLSAIETADYLNKRQETDLLLFKKHDLTVIPDPRTQYSKSKPLLVYFEIYNLQIGPNDYAEYEINIQVTDQENFGNMTSLIKKINPFDNSVPASVATNIRRLSQDRTTHEYMGIDLAALSSGNYKLTLSVDDLVGSQTVIRTLRFKLTD